MRFDEAVDAFLAGFSCLDQLEARVGPLFFDLDALEQGPFWTSIAWPADARAPAKPILEFELDGHAARSVALPPEGALVVGRGARADIRLPERLVSNEHARFVVHAGRVYVEDLGSTNGTRAGGARISGIFELDDGTLLELGANARVRLRWLRPEDAPLRRFVDSMRFHFRCDPYHDQPGSYGDRLGARSIQSYVILVNGPREIVEGRLEARHGKPRVVTKRSPSGTPETCHAYGRDYRYFLRDVARGAFWLEYSYETPSYAVVEPEEGARRAFLRGLPAAIARIRTENDWIAFAESVPAETGILPRPSPEAASAARRICSYLDLEIRPSIGAAALADLWELPEAFGLSTDVHMTSWHIETPAIRTSSSGETYPCFARPRFGPYEVDAALEGWPEAEAGYAPSPFGASSAYDLRRARAAVNHISFWQPRR